ncbi:MAG TPA: hypothetical protein VEV44_15800, partial [Pseudoneobacillus sp.]|nr:hypothetical protein [Pseudoneobacillus sp.]
MKIVLTVVFAFMASVCAPLSTFAKVDWPLQQGTPQKTHFNNVVLSNELFLKHELSKDPESIGDYRNLLVNGHVLYSLDSQQRKVSAYSLKTKAL